MHVCLSCPDFFFFFFFLFFSFLFLEALRGIHELCDGLSACVRHLNVDGHSEKGTGGLSSGARLFFCFLNIPTLENSSSKSHTYQMSFVQQLPFCFLPSLLTQNCSHLSCLIVLTRLAFLSLLPRVFLKACSGTLGIHISKRTPCSTSDSKRRN